jgi:transcriptional regulator with PAS, ATPase and Fis domain
MAYLVVAAGLRRGMMVEFSDQCRIGRQSSSDVSLIDEAVSREHAVIRRVEDGYVIEDLDSRNGTYVNGLRSKRSALGDAAQVRVGQSHLYFSMRNPTEGGLSVAEETKSVDVSAAPRTRWEPTPVLVGTSPAMRSLIEQVRKAAPTPLAVLLLGETGTGKEVVARTLHINSPRRNKPFEALNCAAIPRELFEAELFGYERGAFTGASARKPGLFELAHGGTLFLDEVGELPPEAQAKLLRVLQDGEVRPVGAINSRRVDVRIVSATNRDPRECLREDLYYRLRGMEVKIPPLRERPEDIEPLAMHFLQEARQRFRIGHRKFSPQSIEALREYYWPGNARELRNYVERAALMGSKEVLEPSDLPLEIFMAKLTSGAQGALEQIERRAIVRALSFCRGNKAAAAKLLGIDRGTIYNKLGRYAIAEAEYAA